MFKCLYAYINLMSIIKGNFIYTEIQDSKWVYIVQKKNGFAKLIPVKMETL